VVYVSSDIIAEKSNGKKIKIDLDPKEWIILGIVAIILAYILR